MTRSSRSVLVVDDDQAMRDMVVALLEDAGHVAQSVDSADRAVEFLGERDFDAVISDIRMPGRSGIEMLGELREIRIDTPIILMTAFGTIDSAVEAMQAGAFDYVTKPFKRDALLVSLERAFERRALEQENRRLRRAVDRTSSFGEIIGTSAAMHDIFALIRKVADNRSSVLITGESGTGKELVARTLHFSGARAERPFVPINCTALPEGLMESELFGHVRGAFTGATNSKRGLFEEASGGTLFLDEIGDMSMGLQSKLLRVLQDHEIRPVGGNQSRHVDVRVITATNKDLRSEIETGRFRRDLYYRLNVIPIEIPPLRERKEDIPLLAEAFVRKHGDDRPRSIRPEAVEKLCRFRWEGNARELENMIERALALEDADELGPDSFPIFEEAGQQAPQGGPGNLLEEALVSDMTLSELEERYTAEVLAKTDGNKARAARILGINRRTLYRRGFSNRGDEIQPETESGTA
ncbi:MAG: sigma-54-dependent Fis family transcriptional regulator [Deltaproteobacteria bacterium]|nr:sigma-54-dependent Fis family transcriptional regulator [Deltaproteobacteria bacterium]MBW2421496.1 sigma-54-dependent Fis family transcriptional regulator [Deltaproteobacteria bacterium]